jgi:hypothetical protein
VEDTLFSRFLTKVDERRKPAIISQATPNAAAWLMGVRGGTDYIMNDVDYSISARFKLGLPPIANMPTTCICGFQFTEDWDHLHSCNQLKSKLTTTRHDLIKTTYARVMSLANVMNVVEPRWISRSVNDARRPDLLAYLGATCTLIDVSVVHPAAPSWQKRASKNPLVAAKSREKLKTRKYEDLAKSEGAIFYPLVFESYGAIGPESRVGIQELAEAIAESKPGDSKRVYPVVIGQIMHSLSVALQRGNAAIVKQGITLLNRRRNIQENFAEAARRRVAPRAPFNSGRARPGPNRSSSASQRRVNAP